MNVNDLIFPWSKAEQNGVRWQAFEGVHRSFGIDSKGDRGTPVTSSSQVASLSIQIDPVDPIKFRGYLGRPCRSKSRMLSALRRPLKGVRLSNNRKKRLLFSNTNKTRNGHGQAAEKRKAEGKAKAKGKPKAKAAGKKTEDENMPVTPATTAATETADDDHDS